MPTSGDGQSRRRYRFTLEDAKNITLGLIGIAVAVFFVSEMLSSFSGEDECESARLYASFFVDGAVTMAEHSRDVESDESMRLAAQAIVDEPSCFSAEDVTDAERLLANTP